jgi:glutathione S-transferase
MTHHPRYELYYWPSIPGRGEFIRLAFHEAGVPYVDVARLPEKEGGGAKAILRFMRGQDAGLLPFAPPVLKTGDLVLAQVANILHYLGPRLHLCPEDEATRAQALQLQLTIADLVSEVHDTHHPVYIGRVYEDQKPEAKKRAGYFVSERLARYLGYFEDALSRNEQSKGKHLVGKALSYVDLSMFQVMSGLEYAFPRGLARVRPNIPRILDLAARVAERPRIAAYLASPDRLPFKDGIFRHYPELDTASSGE